MEEECKARNIDDINKFKKIVIEQLQKTAFHYGHPYLNSATLAGVFRIVLKKYEE
ncbi:hypothetical protein KQI42_10205 [Tissierella sp. MSJ-40]|uniref:Uncharacterized protein n=1 Tax=Tissierella simiarum TaxID=2841534 RepID=A0ABS6E812_9FIRM|nr:hypothetical protein [Tissierella simiarum]MBU5438383.1 hypothetical protein [Tissierella simiarum]